MVTCIWWKEDKLLSSTKTPGLGELHIALGPGSDDCGDSRTLLASSPVKTSEELSPFDSNVEVSKDSACGWVKKVSVTSWKCTYLCLCNMKKSNKYLNTYQKQGIFDVIWSCCFYRMCINCIYALGVARTSLTGCLGLK